ncbi:MAG TPA: UvrB/UvrC motif-containing protein, partial [Candidatus Humimicrobiaceae bacterium]|nr:UvrB/UvrC motif-containing protein [Candidatus Humimicrobiaceae bacterium]
KKYGIIPKNIVKPIRERLVKEETDTDIENLMGQKFENYKKIANLDVNGFTPMDRKRLIIKLQKEMRIAAQDLNFEFAAEIRDKIKEISS